MNTNRKRITLALAAVALLAVVAAPLIFGATQAAAAADARAEVERVTAAAQAAAGQADAAAIACETLTVKQAAATEEAFDRGFGAGVEYQTWFQK